MVAAPVLVVGDIANVMETVLDFPLAAGKLRITREGVIEFDHATTADVDASVTPAYGFAIFLIIFSRLRLCKNRP